MKKISFLLLGVGLGAAGLYFADPDRGRRRRAIVRDKGAHLAHRFRDSLGPIGRDVGNRLRGQAARFENKLIHAEVSDEVIADRVRTAVNALTTGPNLEVAVDKGNVLLTGPILEQEARAVMSRVWSVPGVRSVEPRLKMNRQMGDAIHPRHMEAAVRSRPAGLIAMLERLPLVSQVSRLLAGTRFPGTAERLVFHRTINVVTPVDVTYRTWTDLKNLVRFIPHVHQVQEIGEQRWRWVAEPRHGYHAEWQTLLVENIPNRILAWHTVHDSPLEHSGELKFQPSLRGGTRIDVKLSFKASHRGSSLTLHQLFGANPRRAINQALEQIRQLTREARPQSAPQPAV